MKYIFDRGVAAALVSAALVIGFVSCSSEPSGPSTSESTGPSTQQPPQEFAASAQAAARLRDNTDRFVIMPPLLPPPPELPRGASPSMRQELPELEPRPVVSAGSAERFDVVGKRARAVVSEAAKSQAKRTATVEVPLGARGSVLLQDDESSMAIEFAPQGGVKDVRLQVSEGVALYPGAAPGGGDMLLRVTANGVEDFVVFEEEPSVREFAYTVDVSRVPGLRFLGASLEFLDKSGDPKLRVSPPYVVDADGTTHEAALSVEGCSYSRDWRAPWGRPVTPPNSDTCTLRVSWGPDVVYPAVLDPIWTATDTMNTARYQNASVRLEDGTVLTCGGLGTLGVAIKDCEIYNPATDTWADTEDMNTARNGFQLLWIKTGALALGSSSGTGQHTSELYDPNVDPTGTDTTVNAWTPSTGTAQGDGLGWYSGFHAAAVSGDGTYVVRVTVDGYPKRYDVGSNAWETGALTQKTSSSRYNTQVLTVPGTSRVMRVGGYYCSGSCITEATVELYDPSTDDWIEPAVPTDNDMVVPRQDFGHLMLEAEGKVLVYGGSTGSDGTTSAEIYDPTADKWTAVAYAMPDQAYANGRYNPGAYHAGANKYLVYAQSWQVFVYDPEAKANPWGRLTTNVGGTYFYLHNASPSMVPAGSKVLVVPSQEGSGSGAKNTCRIFDFGDNGDVCSGAEYGAECLSGYCVDQVCCDTSCTGACMACRANQKQSNADSGTCGPRTTNAWQGWETGGCPQGEQSTCGNTGYCDGLGACAKWGTSVPCGSSSSCADDTNQVNQDYCDGAGACSDKGNSACTTGYKCVSNYCQTNCYSDDYCTSTYYCETYPTYSYTCKPKKNKGESCNGSNECSLGYCVDGVCCEDACSGTCMACEGSYTGQADGECEPVTAGNDPRSHCDGSSVTTCGLDGLCNGAGACRYWANGSVAEARACTSETQLANDDTCNGTGSKVDGGTTTCAAGYRCNPSASPDACRTSCSLDEHCLDDYWCNLGTGTCQPDKADGQTCGRAEQCQGNDNCVDNVCCDTACDGECSACTAAKKGQGVNGVCGVIKADSDPDSECPLDVGYPGSCQQDGLCDGAGQCRRYAKSGVECDTAECSSLDDTAAVYTCNGVGSCKAKYTGCYPFKCSGDAVNCRTSCTDNTHCNADSFCANGQCVGQKENGAPCTDGTQCASKFCANKGNGSLQGDVPDTGGGGAGAGGAAGDGGAGGAGGDSGEPTSDVPGVCCDVNCDSKTCFACKKSLKGYGADGTCEAVNNGLDPLSNCETDPLNPCGLDGVCNGTGQCRNVPDGRACGDTKCVGNSVQGQICDGDGNCIDQPGSTDCSPYVCRDVSGSEQCSNPCQDDNDCESGFFCEAQACKKKLGNGQQCESSAICDSGYCVDGVCCDASCNGQCEACDVDGNEGVCTPVQGVPHGTRAKCDQAGEECGGACDGVNASACKYAANGTVCGVSSCDLGIALSAECNGQGNCVMNTEEECSPYECGEDAKCKSRCDKDEDCSQGYACDETTRRCLPSASAAVCSEDRLKSIGQNGETSCRPFLCDVATGVCAVLCATTNDCAPDFVCDSATKACLPKIPPSEVEEGACACTTVGRPSRMSSLSYLAALGLVLAAARRVRRSTKAERVERKQARVRI